MSNCISYIKAQKTLSKKEKIAQSFMPAVYINDSEEEIEKMEQLIAAHGIGGICFFHSRASAATNFEGKKEVIYNDESLDVMRQLIKRYQNASRMPLLISIDAEWGLAMRIENTAQYPYAICLGAMQDREDLIFEVGRQIGADCRAAGIHWNFAPVADLNNNPDNPVIGYRSFGEDPEKVSSCAKALMKGLQSENILTSAKHFPGHGDTDTDSHLGLPVIDKTRQELENNELIPFKALIEEGVDSVMVGHLAVPAISKGKKESSSVSEDVINGWLRQDIGYQGVVVSDALNMYAVSKNFPVKGELEFNAYSAGTDILCYAEHTVEAIELIARETTDDEVEEHFARVWQLKEKAYSQKISSNENTSYPALMQNLAEESLCLVKGTEAQLRAFQASKNICCLAYNPGGKTVFTELLAEKMDVYNIGIQQGDLKDNHPDLTSHVVLALYPPHMKPLNNFGMSDKALNYIRRIASEKHVILYLFGNPYVLNILPLNLFKAVVVVFQDFEPFQVNAYNHFLGKSPSLGKLPVQLKTQ